MNADKTSYNLPEGWALALIEDIIGPSGVFVDGDWIESKDQNPKGNVRLIQLADIGDGNFKNRSNRFMTRERAIELGCTFLKYGDILIARMPEPLGRAVIFPFSDIDKFVTIVDIAIIRVVDGIYNKYLVNCINSPKIRGQISALQTGTTRKRISRSNLGKILIPVPPLKEQYEIVDKIEELFSKIDNSTLSLKEVEDKLKNYKQALLNEAFGGKRTQKWRDKDLVVSAQDLLQKIEYERIQAEQEEVARWNEDLKKWTEGDRVTKKPPQPRKRKNIAITNEEIKNLPVLPKGWAYTKIANVSSVGTGITPLKSRLDYYQNGDIPWVTSGALNDWYVKEPSAYVTKTALTENNLVVYPKHTLLIALYGEGKTRGKCSELLFDSSTNQAIAAISQTGQEQILRTYLKWFLLKNYIQLRELASGGAQQNLNISIIENIIFPVATPEEIEIIVQDLEFNFSIIEHLENIVIENLNKLELLRQTILDKAISGKLVPQKASQESATDFLKRIRNNVSQNISTKSTNSVSNKIKTVAMKKANKTILEVLQDSSEPMSAEDVWKQSKHRDNIEEFYAELKKVQRNIVEVKKGILSLAK